MQKFRKRIMVLYVIMVVLVIALVGRLFYIQVIWNDSLTEMAKDQQNKNIPIPAKRGVIVDRNGDKMAFSVKVYSIWAQTSVITMKAETAKLISEALNIDETGVLNKLISANTNFVKLASDLTKDDADLLAAKNIRGISITEDTKRIYPYDNLASHIIGVVNSNLDGFTGLEYTYNDVLKGEEGSYYVTTDVSGRQLAYGENDVIQPIEGQTLVLTIDDTIQYFVEERLEEAMTRHSADAVSAVVMNPKTGEIIAMASKPDFNLNEPRLYREDLTEEEWSDLTIEEKNTYLNTMWKNIVVSNVFEPGSVFKSITASIALEENLVSIDEKFVCEGLTYVAGVPLKCWYYPYRHGEETFLEALENSCNPVFVEVIGRIGVDTYYEYLEKFGLLEKSGIDITTEVNSYTYKAEDVGPVELATMAYGHGNAYTMIQVIRAVSAVVNGGYLVDPHLVKEIQDEEGNVVEKTEAVYDNRVISEETSATMRMMLESVVANGTGSNAKIEGLSVGGKTGSSRKFEDGEYQENKIYASFVGIAPMEDPEYIVYVVVDEPKDAFGGGSVAAPIVKSILEDIFRYENILPEQSENLTIQTPDLIGLTYEEAINQLDELEISYSSDPLIVENTTLHIVDQFPKAGTIVSKNSVIIMSIGYE